MYQLILIFFILISFQNINAQNFIGMKGGISYINLESFEANSEKNTGISGGIYYRRGHLLSLQPEINFREKGVTIVGVSDKSDLDLKYVDIPVLFGVNISFLYLNAGPFCSFLTSAELSGVDVKNDFKKNDFGFEYGGGVRLPLVKRLWVELDGRISHGLEKIYNNNNFKKARNKTWGVTIGLVYHLR